MEYEKTHPWLTFSLPRNIIDGLAFHFGEAASKTDHLRNTPLLPSLRKKLNLIYLTKGIKATTAIEGNTLDEQLIEDIIEKKRHAPESQNYLEQEVKNILEACNGILMELDTHKELPPLTTEKILEFNSIVLKDLPEKEDVIPGTIRTHSVIVGHVYRGAPARECPALLNKLVDWLNSSDFQSTHKDYNIPFGIVQAVVAHIYLAWIHPFGDGNGRTARLVELYFMLKAGIPEPSAHLLSDHYNKTREAYYEQLNRLSKDHQNHYPLQPFLSYALRGYLDGIREQILLIQNSQYDIMWNQFTYEIFDSQPHTSTNKRQRALALYINTWTSPQKITLDTLPPTLFLYYRGKTQKCLQRDINKLISLGLIHRETSSTIESNKNKILTLCPAAAKI